MDGIVDMYAKGLSMREIAEALGVTKDRVRRYLAAQGVTVRPRGHPRPVDASKLRAIIRLHRSGMSHREIAEVVGVAQPTVGRKISEEARRQKRWPPVEVLVSVEHPWAESW